MRTRAEIEARRDDALLLHLAGATLQQIADSLADRHGRVSAVMIWKDINRRLTDIAEGAKDMPRQQALNIARHEALLRGVWKDAMKGDVKSAREARNILTRLAHYTGIDRPIRVSIGGDPHAPPVVVAAQVESIDLTKLPLDRLKQLRDIREELKVIEGGAADTEAA